MLSLKFKNIHQNAEIPPILKFTHRPPPQCKLDGVHVRHRTPHLSNQTLLRDVNVAEVEGVVDGLHLPHLNEPHPDGLGRSLQDPLPVIFSLVQNLYDQRQTSPT